MKNKKSSKIQVEIISGVEGFCLSINNRRICGNKPWGGGKVVCSWKVDKTEFIAAFKNKSVEPLNLPGNLFRT